MNFDNLLIHCSSLGLVMTEPKEKSNLDIYNDLIAQKAKQNDTFDKLTAEYDAIKNKETYTAKKKYDSLIKSGSKIYDLDDKIEKIEPIKDVKKLSATCKNHLMDLFVEAKYGRIKDIKSKYLEKGTMLEEDAITIWSRLYGTYVEKNTVRKSNGYITGEVDFPTRGQVVIHDTKSSWDLFSFWKTYSNGLEDIYYWQMQGYMDLWDLPEAKVIKILLDTPDKLIENEKKNLLRDFIGTTEQYEEACERLEKNMKYPDIPIEERVMEFVVERNDDDIAKIPARIEECRNFLNTIPIGKLYENYDTEKI